MSELKNVITDIRTGALPLSELPGFIIYQVSRPAAIACLSVALVGGSIALVILAH